MGEDLELDHKVEKLTKALEEAKKLTRELHECIKDGNKLHKELETILQVGAEDLVVDVLKHLLPSAIAAAEQKAADDLIKLNLALKEVFLERVAELKKQMDERDEEIEKLTKSVLMLHDVIEKTVDLKPSINVNWKGTSES